MITASLEASRSSCKRCFYTCCWETFSGMLFDHSLNSDSSSIVFGLSSSFRLILLNSSHACRIKSKVKGPDIYRRLPGKPEEQRFTLQSGVLISIDSRQRSAITGLPIVRTNRLRTAVCSPQSAARQIQLCSSQPQCGFHHAVVLLKSIKIISK